MNEEARASIEIVEEPASSLMRFRYEDEGVHGLLRGKSSRPGRKTYPAIKIVNYTGEASVRVSCVTEKEPYKSHPHSLIGENCDRGVCYIRNFKTNRKAPSVLHFTKLSIQREKIKKLEAKLNDRQIQRIDPFGSGFQHIEELRQTTHCVRLCFEAFIRDPMNPTREIQLTPKVTQPIYNMQGPTELIISQISDTSSAKCGGKLIMMFCNKISEKDIRVRFFQKCGENEIWEDWGTGLNIHHNYAISFMTPKYERQGQDGDIELVNVFVQLVRPSDEVQSTPISFRYIPDLTNIDVMMKRKKRKIRESEKLFKSLCEIPNLNIPSTSAQQYFLKQHYPVQQHQPEQQQRRIFLENKVPQEHFPQQQQPSVQHTLVHHQPVQHQPVNNALLFEINVPPQQQQPAEYQPAQHRSVQYQSGQRQPVNNTLLFENNEAIFENNVRQEYFPQQQQPVQHQPAEHQPVKNALLFENNEVIFEMNIPQEYFPQQHQPVQRQPAEHQPAQHQSVQHQANQYQPVQHQSVQHNLVQFQPKQQQHQLYDINLLHKSKECFLSEIQQYLE